MKTRVKIREKQKEPAGAKISKSCSFFLFLLLSAALCSGIALASPDMVAFKSAVVWRSDDKGDYQFDKETFSSPGIYEIGRWHKTDGIVSSITASWKSSGQVSLEVSADNGTNYTPVVCGQPIMRTMRRRAKRINLNKLGLSKGLPTGERVQKLRVLRSSLEDRALQRNLIEEK